MTGIGGHTSPGRGRTNDWLTPPDLIRALESFDLDPACPNGMPWRTAGTMFTPDDDGLSTAWFGRVWLNPPYGPETFQWLELLAEHGNGIALTFARTETQGFFEKVWRRASGVFFLRGRLHFHRLDGSRATGNSGGPSVLVAYGEANARILETCKLRGAFVRGPVVIRP